MALSPLFSQTKEFKVLGTIVDERTHEILPFTGVYNVRSKTGTSSNNQGFFELPNVQEGDTIVISFLGYEESRIVASPKWHSQIFLKPKTSLLNTVTIKADDSYLYDLILDSKKTLSSPLRQSKTYLFSETLLSGAVVEIHEAYYNGVYEGGVLKDLNIKEGRIGLKPYNNQYFISADISRLFSTNNFMKRSKLFADNPFCLSKRQLRKLYDLEVETIYDEVIGINFSPKKSKENAFSGIVFINSKTKKILKLQLELSDAKVHPFIPFWNNDIDYVDIFSTRTFTEFNDEVVVDRIDFSLTIAQKNREGRYLITKTNTFIKAFDYEELFELPRFSFQKDDRNGDLRKSVLFHSNRSCQPVNGLFKFFDKSNEIDSFMSDYLYVGYIRESDGSEGPLMTYDYIPWSENRYFFVRSFQSTTSNHQPRVSSSFGINPRFSESKFNQDNYAFNMQLFMNMKQCKMDTFMVTKAILDPYETYYHFDIESTDRVFHNILFDLLEIERRHLQTALDELDSFTQNETETLYNKHQEQFEEIKKQYFKEVERGQNLKELRKWNIRVYDELGIDNFKIFGLE